MTLRAGFIGLGNQGKPLAANLVNAGFETTLYDIADSPVRELAATGAKAAASPREVGTAADVIGICVPEDDRPFGEEQRELAALVRERACTALALP